MKDVIAIGDYLIEKEDVDIPVGILDIQKEKGIIDDDCYDFYANSKKKMLMMRIKSTITLFELSFPSTSNEFSIVEELLNENNEQATKNYLVLLETMFILASNKEFVEEFVGNFEKYKGYLEKQYKNEE